MFFSCPKEWADKGLESASLTTCYGKSCRHEAFFKILYFVLSHSVFFDDDDAEMTHDLSVCFHEGPQKTNAPVSLSFADITFARFTMSCLMQGVSPIV